MIDTLLISLVNPLVPGAPPAKLGLTWRGFSMLDRMAAFSRAENAWRASFSDIARMRGLERHSDSDRFRPYRAVEMSSQLPTLVAALERHGLSWAICDNVPVDETSWESVEGWLSEAVAHWQPHCLALSTSFCWGGVRAFLERLAASHPGLPCLLGGSSAFWHLVDLRANWPPNLAAVCEGDGEEVLPAAVEALRGGKPLGGIAGLTVASPLGPVRNGEAAAIDLDRAPLPSAPFVGEYQETYYLESMRGCPFRCAFCAHPLFSTRLRAKSPRRLVEEFRLAADCGARTVGCWDSTLSSPPARLRAFLESMAAEGPVIPWFSMVRTEGIDGTVASLMRRSGCFLVYIGIESTNPETLARINKQLDLDRLRRVIDMLHDNDISVAGSFIMGLPGDDRDSPRAFVDFARQVGLEAVESNPLMVSPGTPMFQEPQRFGLEISRNPSLTNVGIYWKHKTMDIYDAIEAHLDFLDLATDRQVATMNVSQAAEFFRLHHYGTVSEAERRGWLSATARFHKDFLAAFEARRAHEAAWFPDRVAGLARTFLAEPSVAAITGRWHRDRSPRD
jgi:radical SAM superfamily enzyme YgiQ (UPF0313 family)